MSRLGRFAAWRERNVVVVDAIITVLLAFWVIGMAGYTSDTPGVLFSFDGTGQAVWSCAAMVPVAMRRWRPQTAALVYAGLVALHLVFGPAMLYSDFFSLLMVYSVIVYGDPRNTTPFIVLSCAMGLLASMAITWAVDVGPAFGDAWRAWREYAYGSCSTVYAQGLSGDCASNLLSETAMMLAVIAACLAATIVLAYWQRARQATVRMLQERNDAIAARQEEERRIAALAERARIARDMHDVVAHTLSIIIIQSDGGRYAGADDPAVARSTMETIRHESERALHDMRRLLGVFGGSSHADYADIDALVEQARQASPGCVINRRVLGVAAPSGLGAEASVAVYRVVQEALTNVRKYAGPDVTVDIVERWTADGLDLSVRDNGRGASSGLDGHKPGYGLIGMRERVGAVGGTVAAGPCLGGGYAVQVHVPYRAATASRPEAIAATRTEAFPSAGIGSRAAAARSAETAGHADGTAPAPAASPAAGMSPGGAPPSGDAGHAPAGTAARHDDPSVSVRSDGTGTPLPRRIGLQLRTLPRFQLPERISPPSLREMLASMRSKPIDQARSAGGERFNVIERLSQWTERHYLLMDAIVAALLILLSSTDAFVYADFYVDGSTAEQRLLGLFINVMVLGPLAFRRRFPEGSAAFIAVFCAFELLALPGVPFSNMLVLVALYSASAYGRPRAWVWLLLASLADSALFGLKLVVSMLGYATVAEALREPWGLAVDPLGMYVVTGVLTAVIVFLMCCAAVAYGRWSRARGANVLILQAREEALKAEQEKQRVLAANMERDRISAGIQTEVTATLTSVIDRAAAGLRMLDECAAQDRTPAPEDIVGSFEAIGRQGRDALARMRQLLRVLRETGFSDEAPRTEGMRLTPAASLDDQLRAASGQGR